MSSRATGRIVGALFLVAFIAYGGGSALIDAGAGTPAVLADVADHQLLISAGALLMLVNSVVVAGIGILVFPVLRKHHEISAHTYLVTRVFEAVVMAVGVLFLLLLIPLGKEYADAGAGDAPALSSLARVAQEGNLYAYQIAMMVLGVGALMFCRVLLRERLVPRFLAVWGMVGYAIFSAGAVLEVLRYGVGLALSVPGGLFEVALGVLLVVKGFPAVQAQDLAAPALDLPLEPVAS